MWRAYSAGLVTFVDFVARDTVMNDVVERVVVTLDARLEEAQFIVDFVVVRLRELRVDAVVARRCVQPTHVRRRRLVGR